MNGTYTSKTKQATSGGSSPQKSKKSPCGCGGNGSRGCDCGCDCDCGCGRQESCCTSVCFERPNYFCGHLLTDDDLTTEVRYVREKNKLYHRALHGHGIVCGLDMRRDLDCPGNVLICEGFAIDSCGNDLVVCEQQSFNVISALRKKGYLVSTAADPCKDNPDDDCNMKQCFWIAARYSEEPSDFESPLESACSPGPSACEPTRIRETVEFDVLDEAPKQGNSLEGLIARFECCFRVLTEGNFANTVKANTDQLEKLFTSSTQTGAVLETRDDYFSIFCQLKAYFLQHIRRFPDPYDARLEERVQALPAPPKLSTGTELQKSDEQTTPETAICGIFSQVWRYISDCLDAALVFPCPSPKCSGDVILGTVEVENGKLVRVCHCSRSYVWSAANFWQVLLAYLIESATCHSDEGKESGTSDSNQPVAVKRTGYCCPEIDLNCEKFFQLYLLDRRAPQKAMLAPLEVLTGLNTAMRRSFNFLDPNVVSPIVFDNMSRTDAQALAPKLGLVMQAAGVKQVQTPASPFEEVLSRMLLRPGDTVTVAVSDKDQVMPVSLSAATVAASTADIGNHATAAQKAAADATSQIQKLTASLKQRDATVAKLSDALSQLTDRVGKLEGKGGPASNKPAAQGD